MTSDEICPRFKGSSECIMHMLRDYEDINYFWDALIQPNQ